MIHTGFICKHEMHVPYRILFLLSIFAVDDEMDLISIDKADEIDPEREAHYRNDPKKSILIEKV